MTASSASPTREDIDQAAERLAGLAWRTPFVPSAWLSDVTGADVWLKLESVQETGSFKVRGAANAVALVRATRPDVTLVTTASAGNHGVALAYAGARLGVGVRVHLPATAPAVKRDGLRRHGAKIVLAPTYDGAEAAAQADRASGAVFISAYSDPAVIAGAGTAALEMLQDQPDLDLIVAPVGGGGLVSGTAILARSWRHACDVVGVEAAASPVFTSALASGRVVKVAVGPTLADGLAGNMEPDSITFSIVRDLVREIVAVDETEIGSAMRGLALREHLLCEGAAATAVAGLVARGREWAGRRIGVVLSGRNVDADVVRRILEPDGD